jgi:hypothetical protein
VVPILASLADEASALGRALSGSGRSRHSVPAVLLKNRDSGRPAAPLARQGAMKQQRLVTRQADDFLSATEMPVLFE